MPDIPEGQFSRAAVVGSTALKIGMNQLRSKARGTFRSIETDDGLDDKSVQQLFDAMIKLRGTAIKLGQMLGLESGLLPDNVQKELQKSWHQIPPLNRVLVRKVMLDEFGCTPDQLFREFESTAFAAASLGQVHNALLSDGSRVAVKIQYPGIHVAMQSDISLMRKVIIGLPQRKIATITLDEIEDRLTEELDYVGEATRTTWFYENLTTPGIHVPRVYSEYSTTRVLTTELMDGKHLDEWLQSNPDQEARDTAAQHIYDCFAECVHKLRRLHADPNPGNYLFRDDGTVVLIDFGCTRDLSEKFVSNLPGLLRAYSNDSPEQLYTAFVALDMKYGGSFDDAYHDVLQPFGKWLTQLFESEYFDFGKNPDYTTGARLLIQNMAKVKDLDQVAQEFIFFDRTTYGLCKVFERLQAKVRMRHHWGL